LCEGRVEEFNRFFIWCLLFAYWFDVLSRPNFISPYFYWWARQDSNLRPRDYESYSFEFYPVYVSLKLFEIHLAFREL
jgi:hypothetical protein